jgi:hypothetical protein
LRDPEKSSKVFVMVDPTRHPFSSVLGHSVRGGQTITTGLNLGRRNKKML